MLKKVLPLAIAACVWSCSNEKDREQIVVDDAYDTQSTDTTAANSISNNISASQIASYPSRVFKTGIPEHRLVTIYKTRIVQKEYDDKKLFYEDYHEYADWFDFYVPGIDLVTGYNLLNVAHYNMQTGETNMLFSRPVLVRSLYYPSYVQDSIDEKPINRNYYLVSVYDSDTNGDTLINKLDHRRFYHFDISATKKTSLLPEDYSVRRSQYDRGNDALFLYARHDANKNGSSEAEEPLHVFWIDLRDPKPAKRVY